MKILSAVLALALAGAGPSFAQGKAADVAAYKRDCDAGKWSACMVLGDLYGQDSHSDDSGVPVDNALAAGFYGKACDGGLMDGCVALGSMLYEGQGAPEDKVRAAALFKKACDAGNRMGCTMAMP